MSKPTRSMLVATLAATLLGAVSVPSPAAAAGTDRASKAPGSDYKHVCLVQLTVHATEDWGANGDEPQLRTSNELLWNSPGSMDTGASAAVNVTVWRETVVEAWERDPDPDDFIGSRAIKRGGVEYKFEGDGAEYTLQTSAGKC